VRSGSESIFSVTYGNFCSVVMMMRACWPVSASASWVESSSMRCTTPCTCSNWWTVSCSCLSSTRRSVITTTLSNTFSSASLCSDDSRCASQAIVLLLPDPAECSTR
jgi:hypothetical protein